MTDDVSLRHATSVQEEDVRATSSVQGKTVDRNHLFTLDSIVNNRLELEHFRAFLADNLASDDLNCWLDIEAMRCVADRLRPARVRLVVRKYFNDQYFYAPTSPASKHEQDQVAYSQTLHNNYACSHRFNGFNRRQLCYHHCSAK